jgi:uncharacterized protein YqjF (DUF2071 family)
LCFGICRRPNEPYRSPFLIIHYPLIFHSPLKNHPFAVAAHFEYSVVLTYAVPKVLLEGLMPECLTLDLYEDRWAFLAVAIVKTQGLRPKGFPEWMGNDFILTGYRIFVRYTNRQGKRLRGLYILKSETDKRKMAFFGNIFTHYHYTVTDIDFRMEGTMLNVFSEKSGLDIEVDLAEKSVPLPVASPFPDWAAARRFAGPLPFTFTYDAAQKEVLVIEGVRENWTPQPVKILKDAVRFVQQPAFEGAVLANAFILRNIPYYWKKGKTERWIPPAESPLKG